MLSTDFPQANKSYGAEAEASGVKPLPVFEGKVTAGPLKGTGVVVTAWKPTTEELLILNAGGPLFVSCLGNMAPHWVSANFHEATAPR